MAIEFTPKHYNPLADSECGDCGYVEPAENCNPIRDPGERLCSGVSLPAGECSMCGGLSYVESR